MSGAEYDVLIIGGGPAGSALAGYLAMAGLSVAIFEREKFPRPHVGESLVPASTKVFTDLGFMNQMESNGFLKKHGAVWTSPAEKQYWHDWENMGSPYEVDVRFRERNQHLGQNYTYHVDRAKFDQLLLQHAQKLGAAVFEECDVKHVSFLEDGCLATVKDRLGAETTIKSKFVVDASGRRTFLGNKLNLKIRDPEFNQVAVHQWFKNFDRGKEEKSDFIHVHFLPKQNSWVWQIPITETVTSIGVVTRSENLKGSRQLLDDFFWEMVQGRSDIYNRLQAAEPLTELKVESDYSYEMTRFIGNQFLMVGDAARFVDPIFSSGVSMALQSARFASKAIISSFEQNDFSESQFLDYERIIKRGCSNWYRFIRLYYRLNVLFTYFIENPKYRLDILKLLQGDVYDYEPDVLNEMERIVSEVENNPSHIWYSSLGT